MSIAQLIAIARIAKESKEEKEALRERREVLQASLCISEEKAAASSELVSFMKQLLLEDSEMVLFPDEVRRMLTSVLDTPDEWSQGMQNSTASATSSTISSPVVKTKSFLVDKRNVVSHEQDEGEAEDEEEVAMIFDFLKAGP